MTQPISDILAQAPDEPVVTWMERPPPGVGGLVIGGAIVGAFVLGALAVIGASVVMGYFEDEA